MKMFGFVSAVALFCFSSAGNASCPYTFDETSIADTKSASAGPVMNNFRYILNCPNFAGNVGIGTVNPAHRLTIADLINGDGIQLDSLIGSATALRFSRAGEEYAYVGGDSGGNADFDIINRQNGSLQFFTNGAKQVVIDSAGRVGIGNTSPTAKLDVVGSLHVNGIDISSDIRLKKNVAPLPIHALDAVMKLRPVTFRWKTPQDIGMNGPQSGFIAQDVEKVLPAMVLTGTDDAKTKSIKYNELIAVLTKAVQEQQHHIAMLEAKVDKLERRRLAALH